MFRTIMCPSSGDTTVFMRHLVLIIFCVPDSRINTVVSPDDGPAYQAVVHTE